MQDAEMGRQVQRKPPQARRRGGNWLTATRAGGALVLAAALLLVWSVLGAGSGGSAPAAAATAAAAQGQGRGKGRSTRQRSKGGSGPGSSVQPELLTYRIVRELPHDPSAFTQGLQFDRVCPEGGGGGECRDVFWESTGLNGQSSVREVEVETGRVLRKADLPLQDFGEGLTRLGDRLYQVTWRSPRAWSFSVHNFSDAQLLKTPLADGWGITSDGQHLVVGDSSERLFFLDPRSMQTVRSVRVMDGGAAVQWLNELEWVGGQVLANVWMTECIARIDPGTGAVTAWATLKGLKRQMLEGLQQAGQQVGQMDVLNGIAWDEAGKRLWVTGKLWPRVYQVELVPLETEDPAATLKQLREECIVRDTSLLG